MNAIIKPNENLTRINSHCVYNSFLLQVLREKDQAKSEHKDAVRMIGEMQTSYEEMKRTKIEIEQDSKQKIEMFTKEIRSHQEKQSKVHFRAVHQIPYPVIQMRI